MSTAIVRSAKVESWEDHVEAWHHIGRQVDGAAWGRAEIAASVRTRYGEDAIGKFASEVGFVPRSIRRFVQVHKTFAENGRRRPNLSFKHHEEALAADDPHAALEQAEGGGWSANALRAYLKQPALPTEACETEEGACGPITPKDRMLHLALLIGGFNKVREYELEPLVQLGTKKSLRELSGQIEEIIAWFESFKTAIRRRI